MRRLVFSLICVGISVSLPAHAENVLRWASQGDALTYDPHSQNEGPTNTANLQIYDPLVTRTSDLVLEPALATEWRVVNPTTWEFTLRQGVKFHNGADFTAEDVVFTYRRAKEETSDMKGYIGTVTEVKAIDDYTVHLITDGPNPILPNQITQIGIMDKDWAEEHGVAKPQDFKGGEETYAVRHANGTSAFKLELREPDVRTITVKNPDWWGLKKYPHNIDKVIYTPIANQATRVSALLSGELDFVLDPPLQDLKRIENTPGLKVITINQIRTIFLGLDQGVEELRSSSIKGKNPLADKRVRQAMYQAIDIAAIQKKVMRDLSIPAAMITSPGVHGYTTELDQRLSYDLDAAQALLTEAGYPEGFDIRLDCPNNRYNNDEAICQAVVGMLGKIGIKVNLEAIPKSLHFPKIQKRETDFYMLGWGVPTLDSHYVFNYLLKSDGSWNATGYKSDSVDMLTAAMATETDLAQRDAIIQEAWQIVNGDIAYLPLHHQVIAWAMSDKLTLPIRADDQMRFYWATFK